MFTFLSFSTCHLFIFLSKILALMSVQRHTILVYKYTDKQYVFGSRVVIIPVRCTHYLCVVLAFNNLLKQHNNRHNRIDIN